MSRISFFTPLAGSDLKSGWPVKVNTDLGNARLLMPVEKSSNYTLTTNDDVVWFDLSSGSLTATLDISTTGYDSLAGSHVFTIGVKTTGSGNSLTIEDSGSGVTVTGSASISITSGTVTLIADVDETNWSKIAEAT